MMKRLLFTVSLLIMLLLPAGVGLGSQAQVSAVNVFPVCSNARAAKTDVCKNIPSPGTPGNNPIIRALKLTIQVLSIIIGITAVIMIVVGGLALVTANGDAQAVAKARKTITYALIGIVVAASAETIVAFVLNKL